MQSAFPGDKITWIGQVKDLIEGEWIRRGGGIGNETPGRAGDPETDPDGLRAPRGGFLLRSGVRRVAAS
jgi:hypothetical protein